LRVHLLKDGEAADLFHSVCFEGTNAASRTVLVKIEQRTMASRSRLRLRLGAAMAISSMTRTCPHCAEPMFLVNLERDEHDQLRPYKCLNCNKTCLKRPRYGWML
jgi:transposase-like protein